jgi:hypothetical protein
MLFDSSRRDYPQRGIFLEAINRSLAVLNLRLICSDDNDYADAIELLSRAATS